MFRICLALILMLAVSACGSKSPTAPSTTPPPATTQTRVIVLEANLDFGDIQIGQSFSATLRIRNTGNSPLTITGLTGSNNITNVTRADWTSGTIPAGGSQDIRFTFTPTSPTSYSGTVTVNGDQTSGTNTIAFSGRGSLNGIPLFTRSGTGDNVIDGMPNYVTRIRVIGTYTRNSSNFIVRVNSRLIVNELLGTGWGTTRYDGTLLLPAGAGTIEITNSSGVVWSITEVR